MNGKEGNRVLPALVEKQFVALDWDDHDVRVVHAAVKKGRSRILRVQSFAIPSDVSPADPAAFGRLLREFLDREQIRTRDALIGLPRDRVTVKRLRGLPPAAPEDLPGVIALQFERELAFPASQAAVDYAAPVPDGDRGAHSAVVAAVRLDVLDAYRAILKAAGLKLLRAGLRPHANRLAVNAVLDAGRHERVLFVDVGSTFTEIDVISGGQLTFTRAASVAVPRESEPHARGASRKEPPSTPDEGLSLRLSGSPPPARGDERSAALNALVMEVVRSVEAYRSEEPGVTINHVVIGGDSGLEERLAEALRERFDMTAELFNPAVHFGWDGGQGRDACGFAAALGLIEAQTSPSEEHIDFLNPKKVVTKTEQRLRKLPIVAAVAALFLAAAGVLYHQTVTPQKRQLAELGRQIEEAQSNKREMESLSKLVGIVRDLEADQIVWIDELHDILACLPGIDQLVLDDITMQQKDRSITLRVKATAPQVMTELVNRLQEFQVPGATGRHYEVKLGATSTAAHGTHPVSGKLDITVVGTRERPDLARANGDAERARNDRG